MQGTETVAKRPRIRTSTISALPYRDLNPKYFLEANSADEAKNVVDGWREEKISQKMPSISDASAKNYIYNADLLTRKYAKEFDIPADDMHPTDIIRLFFMASTEIRKSSWIKYRNSFIYAFNIEIEKADALAQPRNQ